MNRRSFLKSIGALTAAVGLSKADSGVLQDVSDDNQLQIGDTFNTSAQFVPLLWAHDPNEPRITIHYDGSVIEGRLVSIAITTDKIACSGFSASKIAGYEAGAAMAQGLADGIVGDSWIKRAGRHIDGGAWAE